MARITENQLILPALFVMSLSPTKGLTTSDLIPKLRDMLKPADEDLDILEGRNDDKFSQKVRNLKAHATFERYEFAKYENGFVSITNKGMNYLEENMDKLKYLLVNDFSWNDLKDGLDKIQESSEQNRKIEIFDETVTIQEGVKRLVETNIYERSSKLRKVAIEYFTQDNDILCNACKFSYHKFYGEIGRGYIEIHHIKPVFKYEDEDLDSTIETALANVVPLCSNCHRMIHRNWQKPLQVDYLVEQINNNGIFIRT